MSTLRDLEVAERAVHQATILTKRVLASIEGQELLKDDNSPVTIADFGAQALLIAILHNIFPNDSFVGEEDSSALRSDEGICQQVWDLVSTTRPDHSDCGYLPSSPAEMMDIIDLGRSGRGTKEQGRVWVMDPVDGTATFLRSQQYVVALCLLEDGVEQLAVLGCPNLVLDNGRISEQVADKTGYGYRMLAIRDRGSFMRKISGPGHSDFSPPGTVAEDAGQNNHLQRLQVFPSLPDHPLRFVNWNDQASIDIDKTKGVASRVNGHWLDTEIWSAQLRYVAVATGCVDAMVRFYPNRVRKSNIHDHAGGRLLVVEAGGVVTDLDGNDLDFSCGRKLLNNYGFAASIPSVHSDLLAAIRAELEGTELER